MGKLVDHHYSRARVRRFNAGAGRALAKMQELEARARV